MKQTMRSFACGAVVVKLPHLAKRATGTVAYSERSSKMERSEKNTWQDRVHRRTAVASCASVICIDCAGSVCPSRYIKDLGG